ncbi:MAG: 8-amino-7-oxononanoate synthase [Planctomycetota bacterium]|nr:8-amino-7-oxononanoate synthase [Planctomycetota bacterium]
MTDPDFIRQTLKDLQAQGLRRRLLEVGSAAGPRVRIGRRTVLAFASNNYLGLANDPRVREAARHGIARWGWGAGASRLLAGHTEAHAALEAALADFKHAAAAIVFPTGYMTNLGLVSALVGRGDLVLSDRENHASLYDAIRLSGAGLVRYPHGSAATARDLLAKHRDAPGRRLLVTDTVFSMTGDLAPLAALAETCRDFGCMLVLDEAHATGVLGPTGAGLAEALGIREGITAGMGTLSKALGGIGGFAAASRDVCDLLVNRARSFIYTTALPAAACEAAREALRIARAEPDRRERLLAMAKSAREALQAKGFDMGGSASQIIPIIVGTPERALAMAAALMDKGIFCPAIRPPTVPPRTSRLRISLTCEHTEDDIARLVEALIEARDQAKHAPSKLGG